MNLLYLSMWGVEDGLTVSTVFPHLDILSKLDSVDTIYFFTHERHSTDSKYTGPIHPKLKHIPLYSKNLQPRLLVQILDFVLLPQQLIDFCKNHQVDKILARGAPAGAIAALVHDKTSIPYFVESFEPHAQYMLESGIWSRLSLKYIFQKRWEERQKRTSAGLMPVSHNYKNKLLEEGVNGERLNIIPCCVNIETFAYAPHDRSIIREKLSIDANEIVGIYVGKFGGIYYESEAFYIFKKAFEFFGEKFRLIILSPQTKSDIQLALVNVGINLKSVFIEKVQHHEIPMYLSASDFAFSLARPDESKKYLSPIKDGEYWANGLPILISNNIGDDSDIIKQHPNTGVVFSINPDNILESYKAMDDILKGRSRFDSYIILQKIASSYRSFSIAKDVYLKLFLKP